jgi:hypothetical protein
MNCLRAHNSLPAFTLLELIVGMIVSTIALAVIFTAWHIVCKQSEQFSIRSEHNRDKSLLHSFLVLDTESADSVFSNGQEIFCYEKSGTELRLNIRYILQEKFVLRKTTTGNDTFFVDSFSFIPVDYAGDQP